MQEAIAVLKGLFADEPFSFEGCHYRLDHLDGQPKPGQKPHPPLLIGGGGKRVLTIAGRGRHRRHQSVHDHR
jgi:alkanesulfonate monooxygenase SsuD/methylene tetrahydromethanopterin reductase-like flavin-dependent oxidoreductase (luciferase family)